MINATATALLYRRGSPPRCTNIECEARIELDPASGTLGIWAEGIHIRVPWTAVEKLAEYLPMAKEHDA